MYTAERQRAQPYLEKINGPLSEQWYLLYHRMLRIVTNRTTLAEQVKHFLYYAELLAEYTYDSSSQLPTDIPIDLLWQVGERLHRPVALTCYLFETIPGEPFPPPPAEARPDDAIWKDISGVDGPLRARWIRDDLRFREYQAYPGVSSRITSVLHKFDLCATVYIEDVSKCAPWFVTRFVFYMLLGPGDASISDPLNSENDVCRDALSGSTMEAALLSWAGEVVFLGQVSEYQRR